MTLPLFPSASSFDREALAQKLRGLAAESVFIGTSSWKYEGWCGQIYTHERYQTRGRFSQKRFEGDCLCEYADTFPVVCGDFSFYQFPTPEYWKRLFHLAGPRLRFAFKVPEDVTVKEFPTHPRYADRGGSMNPTFLNADLFGSTFLQPLELHRDQVAVLIFEFATFSRRSYEDIGEFIAELDSFLSKLPVTWRYAVEIRNEEFLAPEYFSCLREHSVAHVYNAWTRMPELDEQIAIPEADTTDFTVTRALLRRGRAYEQAVEKFSPYEKILDENTRAREAIREQIRRARERRRSAYIFVNNRLEGNAPLTIEAILNE